MRRRWWWLVLLLIANVAVKGATGSEESATSIEGFLRLYSYFPYPFAEDAESPFLLEAKIGGKSVRLLADTGASFTTIDPRSVPGAKTLGELQQTLHDGLLGEIKDPSVLRIDDLAFGPARFFNQPARAAKLEADYIALQFDGLLGTDFLYRNFCIIDCGGRRIYFRNAKPTAEQAQGIEASLRGSGFTPVLFRRGSSLIVEGEIQGKRTAWILDTGSHYTFLEESEGSRLKLRRPKHRPLGSHILENYEGRAIGLKRIGLGTRRLTVAEAKELRIGAEKWKNAHIGLVDLKMSDAHRGLDPDVHGFLGADFLVNHRALIDFSTDTIWFPPHAKAVGD